jgi:hypothetical protein
MGALSSRGRAHSASAGDAVILVSTGGKTRVTKAPATVPATTPSS